MLVRMLLDKVVKLLIVLVRKYMMAEMVALAAVVLGAKVAVVVLPVAAMAVMVQQAPLPLLTLAMVRVV